MLIIAIRHCSIDSTRLEWNGLDSIRLLKSNRLTADDPDCDFLAQILHKGHHVRCDFPPRDREGSIDIKEGKDTRLFGCCRRHDSMELSVRRRCKVYPVEEAIVTAAARQRFVAVASALILNVERGLRCHVQE